MSKICLAIALMFPFAASAGSDCVKDANEARMEQPSAGELVGMGPDPGGHSGDGVTPETTKTDHPAADGPSESSDAGSAGSQTGNNAGTSGSDRAKSEKQTTGQSSSGQTDANR